MARKFFKAGEVVPVLKPMWADPERMVAILHPLSEHEVAVVNSALALVYAEMDEELPDPKKVRPSP